MTAATGNLRGALQWLDEAILKAPELSDAYVLRADIYERLGRVDAARKDYTRVVELGDRSTWLEQKLDQLRLGRS